MTLGEWPSERRIEMARRIAIRLNEEAREMIMSWRAAELSELILFVLSMPASLLQKNLDKYAEFL